MRFSVKLYAAMALLAVAPAALPAQGVQPAPGGGEALADADYYEALVALLFAATPLIGVLRERPHGEGAELYSLLGRDPDTLILPTTGSYDINAAGALRHWTRDWALGGTF